jgi:hypothetical protein
MLKKISAGVIFKEHAAVVHDQYRLTLGGAMSGAIKRYV